MTWRRLEVLVDALPGESALKTAIRDAIPDDELAAMAKRRDAEAGHGPWARSDLLLAAIKDSVDWLVYVTAKANGGSPKEPEPYPRPGVVAKRRKALTAEGHAYLQRLRDNQGAAV